MESHDNHKDQLNELAELVVGAYLFVAGLLADLPVAVSLPRFGADPTVIGADAVKAMHRARTLIEDEPIPDLHKRAYDGLALDWLTAFDLVALAKEAGLASWRADAIEYALIRIGAAAEAIETGELDGRDDA